jgi:cation diffusion facilitator family transporter
MPAESKTVVVTALCGNLAVAVAKFAATAMTGSSAMFSEGIHSLIDTADEGFLLLGLKRSRKPPDEEHPLGHAHELYFWSFVVAVMILGLGGGVTIYEGITRLQHPHALEDPTWNYVVLGLAAIFEGTSLTVGYRQFRRQVGDTPLLQAIRRSKDPTVFTVVIEDIAALAGIAVAFLGVYLGHIFGNSRFDAAASILIGVILATVALLIGYEVRGLLIGESADAGVVSGIRELAEGDSVVDRANPPITVHLGPDAVLVALELQFASQASSGDVTEAIDRIEHAIRGRYPKVQQIYVEAESIRQKRP